MSKFLDWFLGKDLQQPSPQQADGAKALTMSSPLYSTITNYGWPWSSYSALYRTQPAIRTVVDFIARNIAGLNAKVYERNGNDRPEIEGHPLGLLLHNPNPLTTRFNHTYATIADKCIFDRAYWRKHYERGVLKGVLRIPPSKIWPEYDKDTGHVSYRLVTGEVLERGRDLVVFSGYSPDGGDEGVPPLETLRRILAEDTAATTYRESFWKNQARPSGSIERPLDAPEWSEDARKRFRADFESTYAGASNAGKIPVMEEGMKLVAQSFSARDSELIESRKLTYEEVTRVYGLPFALIGAMSESKSNVESFHRQLYQDVLGPWLRFLQDEIELQLLPEFENNEVRRRKIYVEYNLAEKLKGSFEEQGKMLVTAVGVPYMSANEARARLNLPSIDDEAFDEPVKPLNVMYGGQPAPTVPTEDPGTPENVLRAASLLPKHLPGGHDQDSHGGDGGSNDLTPADIKPRHFYRVRWRAARKWQGIYVRRIEVIQPVGDVLIFDYDRSGAGQGEPHYRPRADVEEVKDERSGATEAALEEAEAKHKQELARAYEKGLRKFFTFQEQVTVSKLGAFKSNGRTSVEAIFSSERWNQHLTAELFTMAGHLEDQAVKLAERINDVTRIQLGNAVPQLEDVRAVFTDAKDNRATVWACKLAGVDSLPLAPKHLPGEHDQDTHGNEGTGSNFLTVGETLIDTKGFSSGTVQKIADSVAELKQGYPTQTVQLQYVGSTTGSTPRKPHKKPKPDDLAKTDVVGTSAMILVPSKQTGQLDETVRQQSESGFLVPGSQDAAQLVTHEYGHVLVADLSQADRGYGYAFKDEVKQAVNEAVGISEDEDYRTYTSRDIGEGLSKYGASSLDELIPEAFAEYRTSPNPRPIAQAVGRVIDAYVKGPSDDSPKHLPGEHDQDTHGNETGDNNSGLSKADVLAAVEIVKKELNPPAGSLTEELLNDATKWSPDVAMERSLKYWRSSFINSSNVRAYIEGRGVAPAAARDYMPRLVGQLLQRAIAKSNTGRETWRLEAGNPTKGQVLDWPIRAVAAERQEALLFQRTLVLQDNPTLYHVPDTNGVWYPDGREALVGGRYRVVSVTEEDGVSVAELEVVEKRL